MIVLKYVLQQNSSYNQNCHSLECVLLKDTFHIMFKYGVTASLFIILDLGDKMKNS